MNELLVIVRQIVIMFLLMSVGFFIYKKKMIDDHSTKQLTDIVLYVVNPALSLVSFQQSFSVDKLVGLARTLSLNSMPVVFLMQVLLVFPWYRICWVLNMYFICQHSWLPLV